MNRPIKKDENSKTIVLIGNECCDEKFVHESLGLAIEYSFTITTYHEHSQAINYFDKKSADLILLELDLSENYSLDLFSKVQYAAPNVPIVVISKSENDAMAMEIVKRGCQDYLIRGKIDQNLLGRSLRYAIERYSLEKQLFQSQKMEELGHLAGGVAHDFNNLLTVILGCLDLIRLKPDDKASLADNVDDIRQAAKRGSNLTRQLLIFSRHKIIKPTVLYLNRVINDTEKLLSRLIPKNIKLETIFQSDLGIIKADRGHIEQVLMNLVVNAKDVMPDGGNITIETANLSIEKKSKSWNRDIASGAYVMLSVTDNGTGMDIETQAKVFNPFFTTKKTGEGSGLGLSVVFGIVNQSGGYIQVKSELGAGTVFFIYLPRIEENYQSPTKSFGETTVFPQRIEGTETILIVEEDEPLRNMVCKFLEVNRYQVLSATSGDEALEICKKYTGLIHLLLVDLSLPGSLNGQELSRQLSEKHPLLKVIYTSGYRGKSLSAIVEPGLVFLEKPYRLGNLSLKIRQMLEINPDVNQGFTI